MAGAGDGPHMTPAGGRIPYLDTIETIDQSKFACLALCSKGFLANRLYTIFSKKGVFNCLKKEQEPFPYGNTKMVLLLSKD